MTHFTLIYSICPHALMANIAAMSDMMYLMFVFGIVFISLPPQLFKIFLCLVAVYVK